VQPSTASGSIPSQLWRHRLWLLPGVLVASLAVLLTSYTVQLSPPSLKRDSAEFAAASTQVLVDFPARASIFDIESHTDPLVDRANVYSRLAASPAVLGLIGRRAGIDPTLIDAKGPYKPGSERLEREPTAERRASQLRSEREDFRLRFDSEQDQLVPVITIYSQAPTVRDAIGLADAAADGLRAYVARVQRESRLPADKAVRLRRLGRATGGVVNPGVDRQIAVLTFSAVMAVWCLMLLLLSSLRGRLGKRSAVSGDEGLEDWRTLLDVDDTPRPTSPVVGARG
jgi:hypothetical protein